MHIQIETPDLNTITSYSDAELIVNGKVYQNNLILSRKLIISPWEIESISQLDENHLKLLLELDPEVILIGHSSLGVYLHYSVIESLSKQRIGIECMSIGSACRTFNVLLSEGRHVIGGFIF